VDFPAKLPDHRFSLNRMNIEPRQGHPPNQQRTPQLAIVLFTAALICAIWQLALRPWVPAFMGFPNTAGTTICFLVAAAVAKTGVPQRYYFSMLAGLAFSAVGDAFLMQKQDFFIAGLGSFLIAHLCYIWAFTTESLFGRKRMPLLVYGAIGATLVVWLWPNIPPALRAPVCLYALAISVMAGQAACRALIAPNLGTILAATGAALFVISDSVLAIGRFGHRFDHGGTVLLVCYFSAQAALALSVIRYCHRRSSTQ
jgi:uncharacterized membrane protein YhhN